MDIHKHWFTIITLCAVLQLSGSETGQKIRDYNGQRQAVAKEQLDALLQEIKSNYAEHKNMMLEMVLRETQDEQLVFSQEYIDQLIASSPEIVQRFVKAFLIAKSKPDVEFKEMMAISTLLFVGSHGSGKSDLACAIPQKIGAPYLFVRCGLLGNEYQHPLTVLLIILKKAEMLAQNNEFVFVVLDEIMALVSSEKHQDSPTNVSLHTILASYSNDKNIIFIATTHDTQDLPRGIKDIFEQNYIVTLESNDFSVKKNILLTELKKLIDAQLFDPSLIDDFKSNLASFSYRIVKGLGKKLLRRAIQSDFKHVITKDDIAQEIALISNNHALTTPSYWEVYKKIFKEIFYK